MLILTATDGSLLNGFPHLRLQHGSESLTFGIYLHSRENILLNQANEHHRLTNWPRLANHRAPTLRTRTNRISTSAAA